MKNVLILLLFSNILTAQISNVIRNKDSYTQDVFPYKGVRAIQIDEVSAVGNEDNVFIFSKIEKNAKFGSRRNCRPSSPNRSAK